MKVMITGANGAVATALTEKLLKESDCGLLLISSNVQKIREKYGGEKRITCLDLSEAEADPDICGKPDIAVHTAFSRSENAVLAASSLDYCARVLQVAKRMSVKSYINISSQSVYGSASEPLWRENSPVSPESLYAAAKYSSEKMTSLTFFGTETNRTNIRLSSVCENARFVGTFVKNMIAGLPIRIIGGGQMVSMIDIGDVADALYAVISQSGKKFKEVYNLGTGKQTSIVEIANLVNKIGHEEYDLPPVDISIEPKDIRLNVGMNSEAFCTEFNWKPRRDMADMIRRQFDSNIGNSRS